MMNPLTRSRRRLLVSLPVLLAAVAACNEPSQSADAPTAVPSVPSTGFSQNKKEEKVGDQLAHLKSVIAAVPQHRNRVQSAVLDASHRLHGR